MQREVFIAGDLAAHVKCLLQRGEVEGLARKGMAEGRRWSHGVGSPPRGTQSSSSPTPPRGIPSPQSAPQMQRLDLPEFWGSDVPSGKAVGVTTKPHSMTAVINDCLESAWRSSGRRVYGFHLYLALYLLHVLCILARSCSDLSLFS